MISRTSIIGYLSSLISINTRHVSIKCQANLEQTSESSQKKSKESKCESTTQFGQRVTRCRLRGYVTSGCGQTRKQYGETSSGATFDEASCNCSCTSANIGRVACCLETMKKCSDHNADSGNTMSEMEKDTNHLKRINLSALTASESLKLNVQESLL